MTNNQSGEASSPRRLRVWPGAVLVAVQLVCLLALPKLLPDQGMYWFMGTLVAALGILVWWVFFSRAPWGERLGAVALMVAALYVTSRFLDISVATAGMGKLFFFFSSSVLCLAFAVAVVVSQRFSVGARRAILVAVILLASGGWLLLRTGGVGGGSGLDLAWRWSPTAEDKLLAETKDEVMVAAPAAAADPGGSGSAPVAEEAGKEAAGMKSGEKAAVVVPAAAVAVKRAAEWPGFRGPGRDGIVRGVKIESDWTKSPPVEMWRRAVGPGWSSFAVQGDLFYTQEQRGDEEIVACYKVSTGEPVWRHRDATRFWEANAGAGPRGTPTISGGRVYTFGATGIVNVLEAATGAVVWSRNVTADAEAKVPYWGFASSPLVVGDTVVIAAAGRLVAYEAATGKPRWMGPAHTGSYSSPHLVTIDGVKQIVFLEGVGVTSVAPSDGTVLWEHAWAGAGMLQPALTGDGDILVTAMDMSGGAGTRRLAVARGSGGWTVTERWTTRGLKPYFNDLVVHGGHAYGFDGKILACIDLATGTQKWKGGRYGNGQMVLLAEQNLLLVLSEEGEVALVAAATDKFTEVARIPAMDGKTWNHPAIAGSVLLVRNSEEMVAFRLPVAGR